MTVRLKSKLNAQRQYNHTRLQGRHSGPPVNREERRAAAKAEKRAKRRARKGGER
jgi:hypothetical protein